MAIKSNMINEVKKTRTITNISPKEETVEEINKTEKYKKSKAGRKKLGNQVDVKITEESITIKKITKQAVKKKISLSLSQECINILNKRSKEAGIPVSQIVEIAIKAFDKKVIIE